jgi:hypothetical protein
MGHLSRLYLPYESNSLREKGHAQGLDKFPLLFQTPVIPNRAESPVRNPLVAVCSIADRRRLTRCASTDSFPQEACDR